MFKLACAVILASFFYVGEAGSWTVSYSGGLWTANDESGSYGPYLGGWGTFQPYGAGSASCYGQIAITLTWDDGGSILDTPPKSVIYRIYSMARWAGDSGSAANGLGDSPVGGQYGKTSEGSELEVKVISGTSFIVYVTPSASSSTAPPLPGPPSVAGEVEVLVSIDVQDVRINVAGSIPTNQSETNILPGQVCLASVSTGSYGQGSHSWSFSGIADTSHHIEWGSPGTNPSGGSYIDSREAQTWTKSQLTSYYFQILSEAPGDIGLYCTLFVLDGTEVIGAAIAGIDIVSWPIYYEYNWSMGDTVYDDPKSATDPNYVRALEAPNAHAIPPPTTVGAYFEASVGTPAFFSATLGFGQFDFTQLVTFDLTYWSGYLFVFDNIKSGILDLDSSYPYTHGGLANSTAATPGVLGHADDSPELQLFNGNIITFTRKYTLDHEFEMFLTFTPPSHPQGVNVEAIALHYIEWNQTGDDNRSFGGAWSGMYPPGNVWKSADEDYPAWRFTWDDVFWP